MSFPSGNIVKSGSVFYFSHTATTESKCILFCLPYGGGGASIYQSWRGLLRPAIDVAPASMPGREGRLGEPVRISPPEIAAAIVEQAHRPYAIYGHSLGARVGFEVIRELIRIGGPLPVGFYPAAALPPDVASPIARSVLLPDDEFLATLISQLGTPAELAASTELRSMFLPVLRHDFRWIYEYRYQQGPPLPVPIMALAGERDGSAPAAAMLGWQRMTSAGFRLRTLPGGHLFLLEEGARLCGVLARDLLAAEPAPEPEPSPDAGELHLWAAALDELPGAGEAWAGLTSQEALDAVRIRDEAERRRFVAGCAVARWVRRRYGQNGARVSVGQADGVLFAVAGGDEVTVSAGNDGANLPGYRGVACGVHAPGRWRLRFEEITPGSWLAEGGDG